MSLPKESLAEAKSKLEALEKKDAERRKTAELKNNLEGYIYNTKDKVGILGFSILLMFEMVTHPSHFTYCFPLASISEPYLRGVDHCF